MTYAPVNVDAYTNAYSGALAGMAISGWIVDPTSAEYSDVATIAGAFAQAFDLVWNSATALNWLQIQSIQSVCQEQFAGHAPGSLDNALLAQASNWAVPAAACAALVLEGDAFVTSEGITPNTPGGGGGGGVNQISNVRYIDKNTAVPLNQQNGTIGAPFASAADGVDALLALVPEDGTGIYILMAFPGSYSDPIVWDPAVSGSAFIIANAAGLNFQEGVGSGFDFPYPTFVSVDIASGNGFMGKGIIVNTEAGILGGENTTCNLQGCQVWFRIEFPLGCKFDGCHFVAVELDVGGGSFTNGTYQSGTIACDEGNTFLMTDTKCTATAITFADTGGTLLIDSMTNYWITQTAPVETGVTKTVMT